MASNHSDGEHSRRGHFKASHSVGSSHDLNEVYFHDRISDVDSAEDNGTVKETLKEGFEYYQQRFGWADGDVSKTSGVHNLTRHGWDPDSMYFSVVCTTWKLTCARMSQLSSQRLRLDSSK